MAGENLHTRLPASTGTIYYVDGALGAAANGGTSETLRSSGSDGVTNGTNTFTAASGTWTSADIGHGISIDVGGTLNFRKVTAVGSGTSLTISGATIAAGSSRAWKIGGPWKIDQDFFDRASSTSTSPAPGDLCKVKQWYTTLVGAITNSATSVTVAGTGAANGFPTSGTLFTIQLESEADYTRGYKGVTDGATSVLTDADGRFIVGSSTVGKQIWIQNQASTSAGTWEQRTVSSVASSTSLTYSGSPITARTLAYWKIINVENAMCTAWSNSGGNCVLTVTRGTQGSMANAHDDGVRVDIPYMGIRATSLSDTGGRHVINSAGTAIAPYTMMNMDGHHVYFHGAADVTADPTRCEVLCFRTPSQYWVVKKNPLGGTFTIERARDAGGGSNSANVFFSNNLDGEIDGIRCRFAQRGTGWFSDVSCQRSHKYNVESYYNHFDLNFNHHGGYEEGDNCSIVNCIFRDHAFGNGIQVRAGAINCVISHNLAVRNRDGGTGNEYAGFWHEGANSGCQFWNNISVENKNGFRGSAAGAGTGNIARKNFTFNNRTGNYTNVSANSSLYDWTGAGNFSTTGASADDTVADPTLVNSAFNNFHLFPGSPAYNSGNTAYTPVADIEGTLRLVATAGPYAAPEEATVVVRSRALRFG